MDKTSARMPAEPRDRGSPSTSVAQLPPWLSPTVSFRDQTDPLSNVIFDLCYTKGERVLAGRNLLPTENQG